MNKICGVYKITSKESGRVYIGSSKNVNARLANHRTLLRKGKHHSDDMIDEWNKFGEDSFLFEVLEECDHFNLLHNEVEWCIRYDATNQNKGFNKNISEPPHHLMNIDLMKRLHRLEFMVIIILSCKMNKDNIVHINSSDRKLLSEAIGITLQSFSTRLSSLVQKGYMIVLERGSYYIDHSMIRWGSYHKLTSIDINKMIKKVKVRRPRVSESSPDNMRTDPETGEIKYTKRGRPCKKPTIDEVNDLRNNTVDM